jgi:hypothetical protein
MPTGPLPLPAGPSGARGGSDDISVLQGGTRHPRRWSSQWWAAGVHAGVALSAGLAARVLATRRKRGQHTLWVRHPRGDQRGREERASKGASLRNRQRQNTRVCLPRQVGLGAPTSASAVSRMPQTICRTSNAQGGNRAPARRVLRWRRPRQPAHVQARRGPCCRPPRWPGWGADPVEEVLVPADTLAGSRVDAVAVPADVQIARQRDGHGRCEMPTRPLPLFSLGHDEKAAARAVRATTCTNASVAEEVGFEPTVA